jgi:hypothetical protein
MTEDKFWEIVKTVNWESDCDFERIKLWFLKNVPEDEASAFTDIMTEKWNLLDHMIGDERNPAGGGDDSHGDLINHVIGLGKEQYEAHLKDYKLLAARGSAAHGTKEGYAECFSYAIPYDDDYKQYSNDDWITKWAKKAAVEIEELLKMDHKDDLAPIVGDFEFALTELEKVLEKEYQSFVDSEDETVKHLNKIAKFFKDNYLELPRKFTNNGTHGYNIHVVKNLYSDIQFYVLKTTKNEGVS